MDIEHSVRAGRPAPAITTKLHRVVLAGVCLLGTIGAFAATQITSSLISNGGNTANSPGGCFKMIASVGQAAVGSPATGGTFSLRGGFLAGNGDLESIFHQSFEVCT